MRRHDARTRPEKYLKLLRGQLTNSLLMKPDRHVAVRVHDYIPKPHQPRFVKMNHKNAIGHVSRLNVDSGRHLVTKNLYTSLWAAFNLLM